MKKSVLILLLIVVSNCFAQSKINLLIKGYGLGKSESPCRPRPVEYKSSYDGTIEKILNECKLKNEDGIIFFTFSDDGKKIVRIVREQNVDDRVNPTDVLERAVAHYGKPIKYHVGEFAIYGDAHFCEKCITDIEIRDRGVGLLICVDYGWRIGRRTFREGNHGLVFELIDMEEFLKANLDGKSRAKKLYTKIINNQNF